MIVFLKFLINKCLRFQLFEYCNSILKVIIDNKAISDICKTNKKVKRLKPCPSVIKKILESNFSILICIHFSHRKFLILYIQFTDILNFRNQQYSQYNLILCISDLYLPLERFFLNDAQGGLPQRTSKQKQKILS